MTSRVLKSDADRRMAHALLDSFDMPCTLTLTKGAKRSVEQNRLGRLWLAEAAEQLGENQTPEELRAYCKLHGGVPILRDENEDFREAYDRLIKVRPYEEKLALMAEPLDFPCTRLMTTAQKTRYLDWMYQHFADLGVHLTQPENGAW